MYKSNKLPNLEKNIPSDIKFQAVNELSCKNSDSWKTRSQMAKRAKYNHHNLNKVHLSM
jgi:hypothetical protein